MRGRRLLVWLGVGVAVAIGGWFGARRGIQEVGGASRHPPEDLRDHLTPPARGLVDRAFEGVDRTRLVDHHVHVAGLGRGGTGNEVNPAMLSWAHPVHHLKFLVYASAAGIDDLDRADQAYVDRLLRLVQNIDGPGRFHLLAFDRHYEPNGNPNPDKTEFYVSNEYSFTLAEAHPDLFLPTLSIHPYRKDAIAELEKFAARGGKLLKWLPNAMGIDPDDPVIDPFYVRMRELGVTLLTHAGEEKAVDAEEDQKLGNPLRLRRPLDLGVRVVVAHCASLGQNLDTDAEHPGLADNFDLFLRLMEEDRYQGLLFGEISAMTQFNRLPRPLVWILTHPELHHRLVNGSDYPLPAINVIVRTGALVDAELISEEERVGLNEIYDYNPLLFDFVVKRTLESPLTAIRFPPHLFYGLDDPARPAPKKTTAPPTPKAR